ncbi:MAG TPA: hypothetical protein VGF27_09270 [Pseudoduganella sp.]
MSSFPRYGEVLITDHHGSELITEYTGTVRFENVEEGVIVAWQEEEGGRCGWIRRPAGQPPAAVRTASGGWPRDDQETISLADFRSALFGPTEIVKEPGSTTRFISKL